MPRIRKKTSNRATTHQRAKLKHKVAEGRKKNKKLAKKNPQWKSKKKKDPGIPNDFPYKEQILAEVAETRRQAEEAKRLRKEEKKALREGLSAVGDDVGDDPAPKESSSSSVQPDEAPQLLNPDFQHLKGVLDKADVVLHVLDARDPVSFRLPHIEEVVSGNKNSKLAFVLNKIDLVPRESLSTWAKQLSTEHPTFLFRSASTFITKGPTNDPNAKGKAKESLTDALGADILLEFLRKHAEEAKKDTLQVAVVGVTNSGKSALVNSLARAAAVPVYIPTPSADAWSTTTPYAHEVPLQLPPTSSHKIILIDTPGVSLYSEQTHDDALKIRDMLLRCRGRVDKLKDPVPAVEHIVSRADTTDLMLHYTLPVFAGGDTAAFLAGIARSHALLKKGGTPDTAQAARAVLRDWTTGRLPFYTEARGDDADGEGANDDVLQQVRTRKEMRRGGGLVRLVPGASETRTVELERVFIAPGGVREVQQIGSDEEVDELDEEEEGGDEDGDDEEDDGEEVGGDEGPAVPLQGKRKRAAMMKAGPPVKKVAFTAGTQDGQERKKTKLKPSKPAKKPPKETKHTTNTANSPQKSALKKKSPAAPAADSGAYDFGQFFK